MRPRHGADRLEGFVDRKQQDEVGPSQGAPTFRRTQAQVAPRRIFAPFCGAERWTKRPLGRKSPVWMFLNCRIRPCPYASPRQSTWHGVIMLENFSFLIRIEFQA